MYTKKLPDPNYHTYDVAIASEFKALVKYFSFYQNLDAFTFKFSKNLSQINNEERKDELKENWRHLILQNLEKASFVQEPKKYHQTRS